MHSFLQSPAWEAFQQKAGAKTVRQQGVLYIERPLPFGAHYLQSSRLTFTKESTLPDANSHTWFLRLEPEDEASLKQLQEKHALQPTVSVQPRQTVLIDLSVGHDQVVANLKQKHRYNLRQAEKNDLSIDIISTNVTGSFDRFWHLLTNTANRQQFRTHHKEYYEQMISALEPHNMIHLLFVRKDSTDLAGMILITYQGTATYLHGASSEDKQYRAPFLLHDSAMQFAIANHCTTYDLWGTDLQKNPESGEWEPKEGHSSAGTSRFKLGFGGAVIDYPGTYDLVLNRFCYTLYTLLRWLRGGKRAFS